MCDLRCVVVRSSSVFMDGWMGLTTALCLFAELSTRLHGLQSGKCCVVRLLFALHPVGHLQVAIFSSMEPIFWLFSHRSFVLSKYKISRFKNECKCKKASRMTSQVSLKWGPLSQESSFATCASCSRFMQFAPTVGLCDQKRSDGVARTVGFSRDFLCSLARGPPTNFRNL